MPGYIVTNYKNGLDKDGAPLEELEEATIKYRNDIRKGLISEQALERILAIFLDETETEIENIKFRIDFIFSALIILKYYKDPDVSWVGRLVRNICALEEDFRFKRDYDNLINTGRHKFYDIESYCKEVYYNLTEESSPYYREGLPSYEEAEEFHPDHLLDLEYHFENIKEWYKDEQDEHFKSLINSEFWRYI